MDDKMSRRATLKAIGAVAAAALSVGFADRAEAGPREPTTRVPRNYLPPGSTRLRILYRQLAVTPRRRSFETLPMVLTQPGQWDSEPLETLLAFGGQDKQVFDTTDLAGGWITQIRNTVNAEVWSFQHPNFLAVAAPHGSAGLALFSQAAWNKYRLAEQTGGAFTHNTFLADPDFPRSAVNEPENPEGLYSAAGNFIPTLQKRGVVFLACHNAIWELASHLIATGNNPQGATQPELAADLTDSLIPGVIATPGNEATIGVLQKAGFVYSFVSS